MKHGYILIVTISIVVLASLFVLEQKWDVLKHPKEQTYAAMVHQHDFENDVEGTFQMNINIGTDSLEQNFGFIPDNLILFNSKTIKGLRLVYRLNEQIIEAGLPPFKTLQFELFDKNTHNIIYTFKQGIGQKIMVDGKDMGFEKFVLPIKNQITGNVIYEPSTTSRAVLPAEITVTDKYLE
tara:strand:+ start:4165 stop:4707 length:543 start_codon:yes stop_codon:yes gene_type:complete